MECTIWLDLSYCSKQYHGSISEGFGWNAHSEVEWLFTDHRCECPGWLGGVHTLHLRRCANITDVSALGGVHFLNLANSQVTDVSALGGVHTLNLSYCCPDVMDVSGLGGVHTLDLSYCPTSITDRSALGDVDVILNEIEEDQDDANDDDDDDDDDDDADAPNNGSNANTAGSNSKVNSNLEVEEEENLAVRDAGVRVEGGELVTGGSTKTTVPVQYYGVMLGLQCLYVAGGLCSVITLACYLLDWCDDVAFVLSCVGILLL